VPLFKWKLDQILDIAIEAGSSPAAISVDGPEQQKNIPAVACVHVVRRVRNLVHPEKYIKEISGTEITPPYFRACFKTCHGAYGHLVKTLKIDQSSDC
jgi:hypothetical protein